jgi:hypothetical protein
MKNNPIARVNQKEFIDSSTSKLILALLFKIKLEIKFIRGVKKVAKIIN